MGFLCEDTDAGDWWRSMVNHFKHAEVYGLSWNSLCYTNFFSEGYLKGKKGKSKLLSKILFIRTMKKQFKYALE